VGRSRGWAAFILCVAAAVPCHAQEPARASRLEGGLYAGAAFSGVESTGTAGTWSVGAIGTWYLKPVFGLRLHYSYIPSALPVPSDGEPLRNHLYDLSLAYRPWADAEDRFPRSIYLFVGGGGLTSEMRGAEGCESTCLDRNREPWTVGQAAGGFGFALRSLSGLEIFGEVALHGYDPPLRVRGSTIGPIEAPPARSFTASNADWSVTSRYVLGLKYGFGSAARPHPPVASVQPPRHADDTGPGAE
jgi:hypothetical protein